MVKAEDKREDQKVLNVVLPAEVHQKLKIQAAVEDMSLKDLLIKMINAYCNSGKK
jgi:predicted HicB family RNase H-like nuclease